VAVRPTQQRIEVIENSTGTFGKQNDVLRRDDEIEVANTKPALAVLRVVNQTIIVGCGNDTRPSVSFFGDEITGELRADAF